MPRNRLLPLALAIGLMADLAASRAPDMPARPPAHQPIEAQRVAADLLVDEYLTPLSVPHPAAENGMKVQSLIQQIEQDSSKHWNDRHPARAALVAIGIDALPSLRGALAKAANHDGCVGDYRVVIREIEDGAHRDTTDKLRLLGWVGMDVLRQRLLANRAASEEARVARRDELIAVTDERHLRLCNLWTQVEMVRRKELGDWMTVPPEYCFGGRPLKIPQGAEHVFRRLTPEEADKPGGNPGVAEEYAANKGADGRLVKHGPYVLWGPNGEAVEQGQFVDGKRAGTWISTTTGQVCERSYVDGELVLDKTKVVGTPLWFVIDFEAAHPQGQRIWLPLGSTTYKILGKDGDFCRMCYTGEVENPLWTLETATWTELRVPRALGKRVFEIGGTGVGFEAMGQFIVRPEPDTSAH